MMSDSVNQLTPLEVSEYVDEYSAVAEIAKYPPFSLPRSPRESEFLLDLSREFDAFVNGDKPYDSYQSVLDEYEPELVRARAWKSLGYDPVRATREAIKKELEETGLDPKHMPYRTDNVFDSQAKVFVIFAEKIVPWEFL